MFLKFFLSLCFLKVLLGLEFKGTTDSCLGEVNSQPLVTQEPILLNTTTNGQLYYIDGNGLIEPRVYIIHLYGSYYEMGYAYGQLLSYQIYNLSNTTLEWIFESINQYLPFLDPQELAILDKDGVYGLLDYVFDMALPYIPQRYIDLMNGVADGSNIPFLQVARFAMIPEAIKAKCSMVGAWGQAIPSDLTLVQLRALDNGEESPLPNFPTLIVYHPNYEESYDFAVLAYSGFVGAFTGYSSANVGISEKYWGSQSCECQDSRRGEPWTFVLQDILEFSSNKNDAMEYLKSAQRTCSIFIGVGDSQTNEFNIAFYSHENVTVYTDEDYPVYPAHPRIQDVLYIDKYDQPSNNTCLSELLTQGYGNITAEYLYTVVSPRLQTGSLHVAVYDYDNELMYISNAASWIPNQPQLKGYQRSFIKLNMNTILNQQLPSN